MMHGRQQLKTFKGHTAYRKQWGGRGETPLRKWPINGP